MKIKVWLAVATCLVMLAGVMTMVALMQTRALAAVGDKAPAFSLQDANGKVHKLSDFKDKVVILNWFASW